jgi:hypothetical protein
MAPSKGSSKDSSKGQVRGLRTAKESQTEIYNKRKALEHLKCGLPKGQLSHQDLQEHGHALSETPGDFPQKKQKLASPPYRCDFDGAYKEEYDL